VIRRIASILLYCVGGLCLASGSLFAFMAPIPGVGMAGLVWNFAPWVVGPLGLGLILSPGSRLRELGIVLIAAAGLVALPMATMIAPGMEEEFPPEAMAYFSGQAFGWNFLGVMAGFGGLLMLAGSWLRGMRDGRY